MTVSDLLAAIRAPYAEALANAVAKGDAHVEPAYRHADGTLAVEGPFDLPLRADLIPKQETSAVRVDSRSRAQFEPLSFVLGTTSVVLSPFVWDELSLKVIGPHSAPMVLRGWFLDWFDVEDQNETTAEGLFGVVHFMSDPSPSDDGWSVSLDLGSAPGQALEDLLFRLSDAGAEQVRLS